MRVGELKALLESMRDEDSVLMHVGLRSYRQARAEVVPVSERGGWYYPEYEDTEVHAIIFDPA